MPLCAVLHAAQAPAVEEDAARRAVPSVALATKLCGVSAPVRPRSSSGIGAVLGREPVVQPILGLRQRVGRREGEVGRTGAGPRRARPGTRSGPRWSARPCGGSRWAPPGTAGSRRPGRGCGRWRSAAPRPWPRSAPPCRSAPAWLTSRKPCFWPRLMLAAISTLARGPICRWTRDVAGPGELVLEVGRDLLDVAGRQDRARRERRAARWGRSGTAGRSAPASASPGRCGRRRRP